MKVGIVTVTYNSRPVLEDFLSSIEGQNFKDQVLYAVDSGSTDETVQYLSSRLPSNARLIDNKSNVGFAAGTNQGIRAALQDGCDAVLVINNDVVFGPDLIGQLADALGRNQGDMSTPLMYYHEPGNLIWAAGGFFKPLRGYLNWHRGMRQIDAGQYNQEQRVTFAPLCCVLIRREVFDRVGFLDERFFTYAEDADFMYRCAKNDIPMWYVPEAKLWHKVSSLTGELSDFMVRYSIRGRIYFLHKHFSPVPAWFWTLVHFMHFALQLALRKITWKRAVLKYQSALEGYRVYRSLRIQMRRDGIESSNVLV
jgi:GT2 family glycosyltransferase